MNQIKHKLKSIDGFFAGSGNCESQFLPILYWKKEIEMFSRLLKNFETKDVKAVVNSYPHVGDMAKTKQYSF